MKSFLILLFVSALFPLITKAQAGFPDSTFNGDGLAVFNDLSGFRNIYSIGLQSDGKIIIGGRMTTIPQYNNRVFYDSLKMEHWIPRLYQ